MHIHKQASTRDRYNMAATDSPVSRARSGDTTLVLEGATLADGGHATVTIRGSLITEVDRGAGRRQGDLPVAQPAVKVHSTTIDLDGYLLLPALVEPHAHLDKALLGERVGNVTYDLAGAISAMHRAYPSITTPDTFSRAARAVATAVQRGCLVIRTHADCNSRVGTRSVQALVDLRESLRGVVDIQVAALAGWPITGTTGKPNRAELDRAMELGVDLVGGAPWLDDNPSGAIAELLATAKSAGCGVDLHLDETTDAAVSNLRWLAHLIADTGFAGPVTASHCVSLGMQNEGPARETARLLADTGIGVVTLPQTNLYLQGRGSFISMPRGLAPVRLLQEEGVRVAAGGDNMQDPFNPMGSGDPLETAMLLVCAGHAAPAAAFAAVSSDAAEVLGRESRVIQEGNTADLVAIRTTSLASAIASRPHDRIVFSKGALVASTSEQRTLDDTLLHLLR